MKNKLVWVVGVAVLLRVVLSAITYHSDVVPFAFAGRVIANGHVLDFYDYLWNLPEGHKVLQTYPRNLFNYPPMVYFSLGGFSILTTSFLGDLVSRFIFETPRVLGSANVFLLLLLLKLPYFFIDAWCAYFVWYFFKNPRNRLLALILWLFNPVNLYATYMMGQFDIIPVMFVLWVLYRIKKVNRKQDFLKEAILLGLGASFKIYPLLFLIPLAATQKSFWKRVKIIILGILTYLATIAPFLFSVGFRRTALVAGQTMKSFYANIPISGGEAIIIYLALLGAVYLVFWLKGVQIASLWRAFFVIMLLFFTFTHYHPQWFLWLTPFLIIDLVLSKFKHFPLVVISLISLFGLVLFFDTGLSVGLFSALNPKLYNLPLLFAGKIDYNLARSFMQTFFVSVSIYYLWNQLKRLLHA